MTTGWRPYAVLLLLCLAACLPGLTTLPPVDRDEARYAQASRQMIETGDWVDIRLQDEARHKKPVGIYWAQAAIVSVLGEDPDNPIWRYRLPSVLGAVLAVWLTYAIGRVLFDPRIAFLGAALFGSCLLLAVEARLAKTDALLQAAILLAILCLAHSYRAWRNAAVTPRRWTLLLGIALGLGVLIKGPIVLLVAGGTVLALMLWHRRIDWLWQLRPISTGVIALAIALPWYVAITLKTDGAFLAEMFGHEIFGKVQGVHESHGAPPGAYLLAFPLTLFPASLFVLLALPRIWATRATDATRFCIAWILPTWLAFELAPTKLPHYVFPTYPALCLLAAAAFSVWQPAASRTARLWRGVSLGWWAVFGVTLAAAAALLPWLADERLGSFGLLAGLVALALVAIAALHVLRGRAPSALWPLILGGVAFNALALGGMMPRLQAPWIATQMAAAAAQSGLADPTIAVVGFREPSAVVELGTEVQLLTTQEAAEAAAALVAGQRDLVFVEAAADADFVAALGDAAPGIEGLTEIIGHNYSKGDWLRFRLYRRAGAP